MALKDLVTDLGSFYENNPFAAEFKSKAGPTYAQKYGFNQRSLEYGKDRPGDGSSRQPFIKGGIPGVEENLPSATGLIAGITREVGRREDDLKRITTFLTTTKGLLFIAKQQILSSQNPIVPGKPNRYKPSKGFYNPLATLANVAASGTGVHLNKQGKILKSFDDSLKYETEYVKLGDEEEDLQGNRLKNLYYTKINTIDAPAKLDLKATGITEAKGLLLSYRGGPGGTQTDIKITIPRSKASNEVKALDSRVKPLKIPKYQLTQFTEASSYLQLQAEKLREQEVSGSQYLFENLSYIASRTGNAGRFDTLTSEGSTVYTKDGNQVKGKSITTYTLTQLNKQKSVGSPGDTPKNIGLITKDFRSKILPIPGNQEQKQVGPFGEKNTRNYTSIAVNKIQRVGLGDPGKRSRDRSNVYNVDSETIDKVSALPLYTDTDVAELKSHSRDFIRFRFEVLDNSSNKATFVHFRAFLGAITDNFGGTWDSTKYVGRGDTFYNYTGFTRTISLSFKVHPQSREEMKAMYQKLTYLASTLAPDYSGAGGYMKGNITRLTIGSYFYRIPGFITSLTYTVPEDASWEIAFDQPEGGLEFDQLETPRHFDVSVNFTPIHDFAPQIMDGTRDYALFTPDQKNRKQPNPYIPEKANGNAISSTAIAANEAVTSLKTKNYDSNLAALLASTSLQNTVPESTNISPISTGAELNQGTEITLK